MPELRELETSEEWDRAVPILRQLWSHRSEEFVRSWRDDPDYRAFALVADQPAADDAGTATADDGDATATPDDVPFLAVAGCYVQTVLHHERGLWIHDFVVDEARRGEGHGRALLEALEAWAAERDCEHVALACTLDNDEGREFYEAVGMEPFGHVLETEL